MSKSSSSNINKVPADSLGEAVRKQLRRYFKELDGTLPVELYQVVMEQIERVLFEVVLIEVDQNQSRAAEILGLSRGTLRKKLTQYEL